MKRPRHLRHKSATACGLADVEFLTTDPIRVTCEECKHTIQFADALVINGRDRRKP